MVKHEYAHKLHNHTKLLVKYLFELIQEGVDILELAIDGRKADVGDIVELFESLHHDLTDHLCGNLLLLLGKDLRLDRVDEILDLLGRDRSLVAGAQNAGLDLCRCGVFQIRASLHVIHLRVIDKELLHGCVSTLRHVVDGHAVVVFLVGIEIAQSRRLAVESDACTERQPFRHVEREVDAWG